MNRDWSKAGSEPSIAELLNDPTTHAIMRHDGLRAEEIWKVVGEARRKLAARAAAGIRREGGPERDGEDAKRRSFTDDFEVLSAVDASFMASLGEWPEFIGGVPLQGVPRPAPSMTAGGRGGNAAGRPKPCVMARPAKVTVLFGDRPSALFGPSGHSAPSGEHPAAPYCVSR